ncbi:MAG: RsmD family RNA methyltransferase [Candidatus Saccharibacteria bacterium]|nr:RsmD family RNA methyltransferase [Candidatus Saccharibacteria bacterium]
MRKRFQKTEIILENPIKITKLAPTGQGISELPDGMKVFLWNALPGETVSRFLMTKRKAHFAEGIATEISEKSADRIEPRDTHFLSTSPWQIMVETYEKSAKEALLDELFEHELGIDNEVLLTESPDNYHYRNKMEYAFYYDLADEKIKLAVHERGSHRKVPITDSNIERKEIFEKATEIVNELNARNEEARKYQSMLLRCNQAGEVSGGLYENGKPHPVFPKLKDSLLGHEFSYSPNGFFQINIPVYELALKRIKELVPADAMKILDLYSGVGTIGLSVADGKDLTLVEVDKSAYAELEENAKEFPNAKPVLAKSEEVLDFITPDSVVILDPPRAGCDEKIIERLLEVHPKKIIYLSCNPITQARDVKMLMEKYAVKTVDAFNFFPRTPHVESLMSLE